MNAHLLLEGARPSFFLYENIILSKLYRWVARMNALELFALRLYSRGRIFIHIFKPQ